MPAKIDKQLHLERDVRIPKITLSRWLKELVSYPGGEKKWSSQQQLLNRRTRWYTIPEIKLLLQLGKAPYRGPPNVFSTRLSRACKLYVVNLRQETVARAETALEYNE